MVSTQNASEFDKEEGDFFLKVKNSLIFVQSIKSSVFCYAAASF